ncbi:interphotoreceptor retinoid-binding protein [Tsuneonella deserti]|uniref:Interphotoreceptor retinoid-binding protein n=1 Tax=Tsuneonella deserti TaxID=2035528 RepID=A0ABQ1SCJ6_9SPHN|nr:S41 family peptidase [Tsuneonella deserti]GGE04950.1 interphotoreceptor retinoid-binding protein [Tsuneonella deserti]
MNAITRSIIAAALLAGAAPSSAAPLDDKTRKEVIDGIVTNMRESYVFPQVAAQVETALRKAERRGEYARISDPQAFAEKLTADVFAVAHDKHIGVDYSEEPLPPLGAARAKDPAALAKWQQATARRNFAIPRVEVLPGNVGYIKMTNFLPAELAGETFAAAMKFVGNSDALVIDLRDNRGGNPAMVAFVLSYLLPPDTHINDFYNRVEDSTRQMWSYPVVPGGPYGSGKPVYVLTNSVTISAAEELAYDIQQNKRGAIVGETTAGGANPGGTVALGEHFSVFIPTGRAINPVSKTNWEGVGVVPDTRAESAKALDVAYRMALAQLKAGASAERQEEIDDAIAALGPAG